MGVFISDMARNTLIRWTTRAVDGGYGIGAYMSPFTSPNACKWLQALG